MKHEKVGVYILGSSFSVAIFNFFHWLLIVFVCYFSAIPIVGACVVLLCATGYGVYLLCLHGWRSAPHSVVAFTCLSGNKIQVMFRRQPQALAMIERVQTLGSWVVVLMCRDLDSSRCFTICVAADSLNSTQRKRLWFEIFSNYCKEGIV